MANVDTRGALTADQIFKTGMRNQWHAVCPSHFVERGGMKKILRLGDDWLLFREADGTVRMLADRCPHRGAPLSQGMHLGDRIAVQVPRRPGRRHRHRDLGARHARLRARGQEARHQPAGAGGCGRDPRLVRHRPRVEPAPLSLPDRLIDEGMSAFLCYVEWDAPWRFTIENLLDPMHGAFLHHESHSMSKGETSARFRIRETDRGFYFEKTDQRGVNFDWVEYCRTGADWVDLEIPYPATAGPGGPFGIVGMGTPIDENTTAVFFWRYRRVTGWERDVWRFLYRTVLEERHWVVLEQDRVMLEAMAPDADSAENLYQHDLGVVRLRRLYKAQAAEQAEPLAGDQEPALV